MKILMVELCNQEVVAQSATSGNDINANAVGAGSGNVEESASQAGGASEELKEPMQVKSAEDVEEPLFANSVNFRRRMVVRFVADFNAQTGRVSDVFVNTFSARKEEGLPDDEKLFEQRIFWAGYDPDLLADNIDDLHWKENSKLSGKDFSKVCQACDSEETLKNFLDRTLTSAVVKSLYQYSQDNNYEDAIITVFFSYDKSLSACTGMSLRPTLLGLTSLTRSLISSSELPASVTEVEKIAESNEVTQLFTTSEVFANFAAKVDEVFSAMSNLFSSNSVAKREEDWRKALSVIEEPGNEQKQKQKQSERAEFKLAEWLSDIAVPMKADVLTSFVYSIDATETKVPVSAQSLESPLSKLQQMLTKQKTFKVAFDAMTNNMGKLISLLVYYSLSEKILDMFIESEVYTQLTSLNDLITNGLTNLYGAIDEAGSSENAPDGVESSASIEDGEIPPEGVSADQTVYRNYYKKVETVLVEMNLRLQDKQNAYRFSTITSAQDDSDFITGVNTGIKKVDAFIPDLITAPAISKSLYNGETPNFFVWSGFFEEEKDDESNVETVLKLGLLKRERVFSDISSKLQAGDTTSRNAFRAVTYVLDSLKFILSDAVMSARLWTRHSFALCDEILWRFICEESVLYKHEFAVSRFFDAKNYDVDFGTFLLCLYSICFSLRGWEDSSQIVHALKQMRIDFVSLTRDSKDKALADVIKAISTGTHRRVSILGIPFYFPVNGESLIEVENSFRKGGKALKTLKEYVDIIEVTRKSIYRVLYTLDKIDYSDAAKHFINLPMIVSRFEENLMNEIYTDSVRRLPSPETIRAVELPYIDHYIDDTEVLSAIASQVLLTEDCLLRPITMGFKTT